MTHEAEQRRRYTWLFRSFFGKTSISTLIIIAAAQYQLGSAVAQPHRVTSENQATLWAPAEGPIAAPDLMQTVALPVSRTRLADRWRAVAELAVPHRPEVADLLRQVRGEPRRR